MHQLVLGQRWVSQTEPELGLGMLVDMNDRILSVRFEASDCVRQYARRSAPLKRVIFKPGDQIQIKEDQPLIIDTLSESNGLVYYCQNHRRVCETDLSDLICFALPQDRLFAGLVDTNDLFDLRYQLLAAKADYDGSLVKGFLGGQVELIPHQFFIADTVTSRYIPRVLLSDETGLGKTIEACLILHKLLMTGRAERVLVIVPESLVHQWFIELYRKFNLSFMIFDQEYCHSLECQALKMNPFLEHQLGIISMDMLENMKRQEQIVDAGWDMVVIDEAHHITDDQRIYEFMKTLAQTIFGMMLLTATPEQMGVKNHFLHLQLLDPERYFDYPTYLAQTQQYKQTIARVNALLKKNEKADHILDSYGPGRVIFRNKRQVVKGFSKRKAHLIPLAATESEVKAINREFFDANKTNQFDFRQDPRILYLVQLMKQTKKLLVVCCSKEKAAAIEKAIAAHTSMDVIRFDETMSLLQRDKNAAWFSRKEGARILVCSEIGSEGRNFQFVHHLFLFDLPLNPELLEQRIGRVDRIGQKKQIQIHVPFVLGSAYEILARWYMNGLELFENNMNGVHLIYKQFEPDLCELFKQVREDNFFDDSFFKTLIDQTRTFCLNVEATLAQGKNILLEMNSFKPAIAKKIIEQIVQVETANPLEDLLVKVWDHYGIEIDGVDKTIFKLNTQTLTDEKFPAVSGLSDAITFERSTAIVRDDVDFFTWDHPFVRQTIDYFLTNGTGSCTTALLKGQGSAGLFLEMMFMVTCVAPKHLNLERYLKPYPIRIVVDHQGNDVTQDDLIHTLSAKLMPDQSDWFMDMEQVRQTILPGMIEKGLSIAEHHCAQIIKKGIIRVKQILGQEITRLVALKKINPDIRKAEIDLANDRMSSVLAHLLCARSRMDALRLIRVQ
ncbi:MAG: SNF2-related protein [Pseudomonadota bacterium]